MSDIFNIKRKFNFLGNGELEWGLLVIGILFAIFIRWYFLIPFAVPWLENFAFWIFPSLYRIPHIFFNSTFFALFHMQVYGRNIKEILQGENTLQGSFAHLMYRITKDETWELISNFEKIKIFDKYLK